MLGGFQNVRCFFQRAGGNEGDRGRARGREAPGAWGTPDEAIGRPRRGRAGRSRAFPPPVYRGGSWGGGYPHYHSTVNLFRRTDPRIDHLLRDVETLERQVEALLTERAVFQAERDRVIGTMSALENRVRAMLTRAEKVKKEREHVSGDFADETNQRNARLDAALLAAKPRKSIA